MRFTNKIIDILNNYGNENPGVRINLARILMSGKLAGTGKLLILPVDQGFEHGPVRSFESNQDAYDPVYHYELAIESGLSAFAAPLGMLEIIASKNIGMIPTILKINSNNSMMPNSSHPDQAITASVDDALRLGCSAIGFTIYPGSNESHKMISDISYIAKEAKNVGLPVVIWSYPRGEDLSKDAETAIDTVAYAAHIAALIGAHIIKVKPPTNYIENSESDRLYKFNKKDFSTLEARIAHIKQSCFAGKRLVVFSGGNSKNLDDLYAEINSIASGGGDGSIIGRNSFQRPKKEALEMLDKIINTYKKYI